jgi:hypothetical protein
MKRMLPAAAALVVGSCAVPEPQAERHGPPLELAGRIAGPPQQCVVIDQLSSLRPSENDPHTLIYGSGRTVWANNLGDCRFGADDVLVTEPIGSNHCRGDLVRSIDRVTRSPGPACILSNFVPYRR